MKKVIIIANEKKSEFNSELPTIFHKILDKPTIKKIVDNFSDLGFDDIVTLVDDDANQLESVLDDSCRYIKTSQEIFDFKALKPLLKDEEGVTVLTFGNIPLVTKKTYSEIVEEVKQYPMVVITADKTKSEQDRILRNPAETIRSIIRYEEATSDHLSIKEVNMNVYAFDNKLLYKYIHELDDEKEFYDAVDLTAKFKEYGHPVFPHKVSESSEAILIKTRKDLVNANYIEQYRINNYWLEHDVTIYDIDSVAIGSDVEIGMDTVIYGGTSILGKTVIGKGNTIMAGNSITDSIIGDHNVIEQSKLFDTKLGNKNIIGPWTNLRTGTVAGDNNKIGTNVELKVVTMKDNNALSHNVYLGNTMMGSGSNIGWGVVTANYDGIKKNTTTIGDHCFVGSSYTIIAPVNMGDKVLVAAGSVINEDIPTGAMGIARVHQENKDDKGRKYIERVE